MSFAHIDFGRLGESSYRMDVVVQNDDPHHDPEAEGHRLLAGEAAAVLPEGTGDKDIRFMLRSNKVKLLRPPPPPSSSSSLTVFPTWLCKPWPLCLNSPSCSQWAGSYSGRRQIGMSHVTKQQGSVHCAGTKALTVSIYPATFWQKQGSEHFKKLNYITIGLVADDFFSLLANSKLHLYKKKRKSDTCPAHPVQSHLRYKLCCAVT